MTACLRHTWLSRTWLRHTRTVVLAIAIGTAGLALGAGCTSDDLGSDSDRDRSPSRSDDARNGDARSADGSVPQTARLVKRDFGDLTFRAPDDGKIWVVESSKDRVIFTDRVRRGDEFRLEPERNRASLNDRTVIDKDLKRDIRHRIYFESDYRSDRYRSSGDTEWDLASDRQRARDRELERERDLERDRDLGDDRISRDPYRY